MKRAPDGNGLKMLSLAVCGEPLISVLLIHNCRLRFGCSLFRILSFHFCGILSVSSTFVYLNNSFRYSHNDFIFSTHLYEALSHCIYHLMYRLSMEFTNNFAANACPISQFIVRYKFIARLCARNLNLYQLKSFYKRRVASLNSDMTK